jgi:cytochrome c biogenesis factor
MASSSQYGPGTGPLGQKQIRLWRYDAAYACYGFIALVAMFMGYVTTFVANGMDQEGYGFFFMMLIPPVLVALIAIVVLTAMNWRDRPLLILFVIHLLFFAGMTGISIEGEKLGASSDTLMSRLLWSYALIFLVAALLWFAGGRRRYRDEASHSRSQTV